MWVSTVRVVVDVEFTRVQSYRVYPLYDPFRLVVDIYPRGAAEGAPPAPDENCGLGVFSIMR